MAEQFLKIKRGKTFTYEVQWETDPVVRKPITGVSLAGGAPRLTVVGHGLVNDWRVKPYGVVGARGINDVGWQEVTGVDADTIILNGVTPVDESGRIWTPYTSGGFIMFKTPHDLTGYLARMDIKDKEGGTVLASSDIAASPKDTISVTVDAGAKKIIVIIAATASAAYTFNSGVSELELTSPLGVVTSLRMTSGSGEFDRVVVEGEIPT
jgi:hypothetical protein